MSKITLDDPDTKKAVELYRNGASLEAAAKAVYITAMGLRYRFKVLGIPLRTAAERTRLAILPDDPKTLKAAELYKNGAPLHEAAGAIGMSANGLRHRFKVLGIPQRTAKRITPEVAEAMRKEYVPYKNSLRRIAEKYGVCIVTVHKFVKGKGERGEDGNE